MVRRSRQAMVMEFSLNPLFVDLTDQPFRFFNILPKDWQEDIVPFWGDYQSSSHVHGIELQHEIVGGGIVFKQVAPDVQHYKDEAEKLLNLNLLYFAFLWVDPEMRGKNLGSWWISRLKEHYSPTTFWLSIEDVGLLDFYQRNNFKVYKEILIEHKKEWILIPSDFTLPQELF